VSDTCHNALMERGDITPSLVARLVEAQFPEWAALAVTPVELDGWDNITFRLGQDMSVRLPSGDAYSAQVAKEHRWLPVLAPHLPVAIPEPLARGVSGCGYPWPWSVYRWLPGAYATVDRIADLTEFARSVGGFLVALRAVDPADGPSAGPDTQFRGGPLSVWDLWTRETIASLAHEIDADRATEVWTAALAAKGEAPPMWFHGDITPSNLLVADGRLSAVIDFGCSGVGDPACDLAIAWTFFAGGSRRAFMESVPADGAAWERGRGWALWKALVTQAEAVRLHPREVGAAGLRFGWSQPARAVIDDVIAGYRTAG
jgi:aminoglycoside phosphotransferase (APT) family kinase protein